MWPRFFMLSNHVSSNIVAMRLRDKVALITGAGTGIGLACAEAFAAQGARVALMGRRREPLQELAARIGDAALVFAGDVGQMADCERAVRETVERFGAWLVL